MNTILRVMVVFALLLMCGVALADVATPQVPETQGFSVQTRMDLIGTATHQDNIVWRLSSEVLGSNSEFGNNEAILNEEGTGNWNLVDEEWVWSPGEGMFDSAPFPDLPPGYEYFNKTAEPPLNPAGEVQMAVAYSENTIADQGLIAYTKSIDIETGYLPINQQNLKATRMFRFQGSETGRAVSTEDTTLDTVGNSIILQGFEPYICPFAHSLGNCIPPFCNIIESGSSIDMTRTSLASDLGVRSVGSEAYGEDETWPPIPVVDGPPVTMDYSIRITGVTPDSPALGSATAYIQAHLQEGGSTCPGCGNKFQDIVYNEITTASGEISLFDKVLSYESGIRRNG